MRYAAIRKFDVTNGPGNGVSLFVQGCHFHCYQCFNPETWDFNGGKEWTPKVDKKFFQLIDRPYIKRITFLGGSPLCDENVTDVDNIISRIRKLYPEKDIWIYTGMTWDQIMKAPSIVDDENSLLIIRQNLMTKIDVLVDGSFEYDKRDLSLKFRGSSNQRLIDVPQTLQKGEIVLWDNEI